MRKAKNTPLAAVWFRFSARRANGDIFPPPPLLPGDPHPAAPGGGARKPGLRIWNEGRRTLQLSGRSPRTFRSGGACAPHSALRPACSAPAWSGV